MRSARAGLKGMAAALTAISFLSGAGALAATTPQRTASTNRDALRVCADANNLPQSNSQGEGYENKIAEALAHDLGLKLEYTYFPQRIGFVRNTLRAKEEPSGRFKCDVIMGVPYPYELTATTHPYMHSTYALVYRAQGALASIESPADLLKLPASDRATLRIGLFALTPAADWVLRHGLIGRAVLYPAQSGDPKVTALSTVEADFAAGRIDAAILWGPIAGYLVSRRGREDHLRLAPFGADPTIRFDYAIAMGVRFGENDWKSTLDRWIAEHRSDIDRILTGYHVPLLP
ncbi:MAG TPA: quinoprotein dehydrogenase-associated putative ABC transporter substrate-binding protein [Steroidobacteraceae bacterium]|nr:quinoprotein dehydrogenase-associated putative ABC transporter substrate-binding protein [Steroidobacteraceae bacterium]